MKIESWLIDQLISRLVHWLICWLIVWLIDWLTDWFHILHISSTVIASVSLPSMTLSRTAGNYVSTLSAPPASWAHRFWFAMCAWRSRGTTEAITWEISPQIQSNSDRERRREGERGIGRETEKRTEGENDKRENGGEREREIERETERRSEGKRVREKGGWREKGEGGEEKRKKGVSVHKAYLSCLSVEGDCQLHSAAQAKEEKQIYTAGPQTHSL